MVVRRVLATGIGMGESVRSHRGRIWFADWMAGEIRSVDPDGTAPRVEARHEGMPLSIDWVGDDLVVVDGANRRLLRGPDEARWVDLRPLCDAPWNEIAVHPAGWVYVDCLGGEYGATPPGAGIVAVIDPAGAARVVADGLEFPNGMAVTPDGRLLVAESDAARISAYAIEPATGALGERSTFAAIPESAPDGITLTGDGRLWFAEVPGRRIVEVGADGEVLREIGFDDGCFSCAATPDGIAVVTARYPDMFDPATRSGTLHLVTGL